MSSYDKAVKAINKSHVLLVYPIKNAKEPQALWHKLFPRSEMRWEWTDDADDKVVKLWHLKTDLSEQHDVVYGKWFRGRATFFSHEIAPAFLKLLGATDVRPDSLDPDTGAIYEELLSDSPQTPKMLREATDLMGSIHRAKFEKALKPLWERMLIVGSGEVDEGNFPSLAMGATKNIFEEIWEKARQLDQATAEKIIADQLPKDSLFLTYLQRIRKKYKISN